METIEIKMRNKTTKKVPVFDRYNCFALITNQSATYTITAKDLSDKVARSIVSFNDGTYERVANVIHASMFNGLDHVNEVMDKLSKENPDVKFNPVLRDNPYMITHIPTGTSIFSITKKGNFVDVCAKIDPLIDWSYRDVKKIVNQMDNATTQTFNMVKRKYN